MFQLVCLLFVGIAFAGAEAEPPRTTNHETPANPLKYGYKIVKRDAEAEPEANADADAWGYYGYPYYRGYYGYRHGYYAYPYGYRRYWG